MSTFRKSRALGALGLALAALGCSQQATERQPVFAADAAAHTERPRSTACSFDKVSGVFAVTLKDGDDVRLDGAGAKYVTVNGDKCAKTGVEWSKVKAVEIGVAAGEPATEGVRVTIDQSKGPHLKGSPYQGTSKGVAAKAPTASLTVTLRGIPADELWVETTNKADEVSWIPGTGLGTGDISTDVPSKHKTRRLRDVSVVGAGLLGVRSEEGNDTVDFTDADVPVVLYGGKGNDTLLGGGGADKLFGENGNDVLNGGAGCDDNDGGLGKDANTDTSSARTVAGIELDSSAGQVCGVGCGLDERMVMPDETCTACADGEYSDGGTVTTCTPIECAQDEFWDKTARACTACADTAYSAGGNVGACTDIACAQDEYFDRTGRACTDCYEGSIADGTTDNCTPINCGVNELWDADARACVACGPKETSDGGYVTACVPHPDVCASGCPFSSISAAIEAAYEGDTIVLAPGEYHEADTIVVNKSLTIVGSTMKVTTAQLQALLDGIGGAGVDVQHLLDLVANPPDINGTDPDSGIYQPVAVPSAQGDLRLVANTVLYGDLPNPHTVLAVTPGAMLTLSNVVLAKGQGVQTGYIAGGLSNLGGTVIGSNVTVIASSSDYAGGGIINYQGTALFDSLTVVNCSAPLGGGIINYQGDMTLSKQTWVAGNSASATSFTPVGGGIANVGKLTIRDTAVIAGNKCDVAGGGIATASGSLTLGGCSSSGQTVSCANDYVYVGENKAGNSVDQFGAGGGLYVSGDFGVQTDVTIQGHTYVVFNEAARPSGVNVNIQSVGGGIALGKADPYSNVVLKDDAFVGYNKATGPLSTGGGISVEDGNLKLLDRAAVVGNRAITGGGIGTYGFANVTVGGCGADESCTTDSVRVSRNVGWGGIYMGFAADTLTLRGASNAKVTKNWGPGIYSDGLTVAPFGVTAERVTGNYNDSACKNYEDGETCVVP